MGLARINTGFDHMKAQDSFSPRRKHTDLRSPHTPFNRWRTPEQSPLRAELLSIRTEPSLPTMTVLAILVLGSGGGFTLHVFSSGRSRDVCQTPRLSKALL